MSVKKLTKTEFYDVYGISLVTGEKAWLVGELSPLLFRLADRYIEITDAAVRSELRHIGKRTGIQDKRRYYKDRKTLDLDTCVRIFNSRTWEDQYGGSAWAKIARALAHLCKVRREEDFPKILLAIDRLNDLYHNNALYLESYVTFFLDEALTHLDWKFDAEPEAVLRCCSDEVRQAASRSISKVAEYHRQF